jgi:hypothetical protein
MTTNTTVTGAKRLKPLALKEWRYPKTYRTVYAREPRGIFQADIMELYLLWYKIFDEYERNVVYRPKIMLSYVSMFSVGMYGP